MNGVENELTLFDLPGAPAAVHSAVEGVPALVGRALSGADRQRFRDALTCLREAASDALEVVAELRYTRRIDTHGLGHSGRWSYCVCRAGLRFRPRGQDVRTQLVTWDELTALVGEDPRRVEVGNWAAGLPEPRWRLLQRPFELWPDPHGWHISYFCRDHVDVEWPERRRAWQLVLDLLDGAIGAVDGHPAGGDPVAPPQD